MCRMYEDVILFVLMCRMYEDVVVFVLPAQSSKRQSEVVLSS